MPLLVHEHQQECMSTRLMHGAHLLLKAIQPISRQIDSILRQMNDQCNALVMHLWLPSRDVTDSESTSESDTFYDIRWILKI